MKIDKKITKETSKSDYNQYFSTILYCLYKLGNNEKYSTLSELPFILDGNNLLSFLEFYGGKTISIPTKEELLNVISALKIYQNELNGQNVDLDNVSEKILEVYREIKKIQDELIE